MPLLALQIKEILVEESNVQPVNSPVTVSWLAPAQGGHNITTEHSLVTARSCACAHILPCAAGMSLKTSRLSLPSAMLVAAGMGAEQLHS